MTKPTGKLLFAYGTISALESKIAEREKECDNLKRPIELGDRVIFTKVNLEFHNLEQQAKGVEDFVADYKGDKMDFSQAERRMKQLREGVE